MSHDRFIRTLFLAAAAVALSAGTAAQTIQNEVLRIHSSDNQTGDEFSSGIALEGDRLLAGAGRADAGISTTTNEGAAYVLDFDGADWVETQILSASDAQVSAEFGGDVALNGHHAIIGARLHDVGANANQGQVYVFVRDEGTGIWSESQILVASDGGATDQFGAALALDGEWLFVGAQFADEPASATGDEGAIYIFREVDEVWTEFAKFFAPAFAPGALFGASVDVEGNRAVVGEQHGLELGEDWGVVHVFEWDGVAWAVTASILASDGAVDGHFGVSVALDGDRIAVGADSTNANTTGALSGGRVYVNEYDGTTWNETASLSAGDAADLDLLGFDVDLQGDFLVAGARDADGVAVDEGAAYLFEYSGTAWTEIAKLKNSNAGLTDRMGREVQLCGTRAMVSASTSQGVNQKVGQASEFDVEVNALLPHAAFTADVTSGVAPLSVQFTDLSTGDATFWSWDFGDGNSSTEQNPLHVYALPGTYDVTLVATGANGSDTELKPGFILVTGLDAAFTADVTSGAAPLSVQFTDLSAGSISSWSWDFGDGSFSTDQNPLHVYVLPGEYDVTLVITGTSGSDTELKPDFILVTGPVAAFTADVTSGGAPLSVQFTDLSTGNFSSWSWDFGDGDTSTEQNPLHVYVLPGEYDVTLMISGANGSDTELKPDFILVTGPAASATLRNGAGTNAVVYGFLNLPVLGTTYDVTIDVSGHAGATFTIVVATDTILDPGLPLLGEELLVAIEGLGGVTLLTSLAFPVGSVATHSFPIPFDAGLAGLFSTSQGVIFGSGIELVNAIDIVIGY